jgi:hypothetical protein
LRVADVCWWCAPLLLSSSDLRSLDAGRMRFAVSIDLELRLLDVLPFLV